VDPLLIARWQFGITTVYHFWMVPLTIGLGPLIVLMQWRWIKTGNERHYRMTKFWGKLFLINFIMGVATGIVQEFQFGMAWSEYSKFVGDVFGAPLAMEALLAFFLESTFLGLWIFGWGKLPKRIHLACLTIAVIGSVISAYFIIVANSWMQHPVGVSLVDGHPVMTDVWALLTNNTALWAFTHTLFGSFGVGGAFLLGIAWYHLWQRRRNGIDTVDADGKVVVGEAPDVPGRDKADHKVWLTSLRIGAVTAIVAFSLVAITGDGQARLLFQQQPMKMASAEAACHTGTSFSVLAIGSLGSKDCKNITDVISIPGVLSFLANGDFTTPIKGVDQLIPEYQQKYGTHLPDNPIYGNRAGEKIDYVPIVEVTYWGFRLMIFFGAIAAFAAAVALWLTRKGTVPSQRWLMWLAVAGIFAPFAANSAGWIFTEMGRQPFVVAPNPTGVDGVFMFTAAAVSPGVNAGELLFSVIALTSVYALLMVFEIRLMVRYVRGGVASALPELADKKAAASDDDDAGTPPGPTSGDDVLAFAY
jgi:cytochrome d ubiquinol oxidase subunit I